MGCGLCSSKVFIFGCGGVVGFLRDFLDRGKDIGETLIKSDYENKNSTFIFRKTHNFNLKSVISILTKKSR